MSDEFHFYEFFAGGGMARVGLADSWHCLFANDVAKIKIAAYRAKWGSEHLDTRDVAELQVANLPSIADLAWASFPCQDLSVAGNGLGIGEAGSGGTRSGALWPFLGLLRGLRAENRQPGVIALENVVGLLTSNSGKDFEAICRALKVLGYVFGAVVIDAKHFLPQSRPRIFVVGVLETVKIPECLICAKLHLPWHTQGIARSHAGLAAELADSWRWWDLGEAPILAADALVNTIDLGPTARWNTPNETERLLAMMTSSHLERLDAAKKDGGIKIGSLYLRMRPVKGKKGKNVQRAEISFGETLGCLRTPRGGGSRPRIIVVQGDNVRTRLLDAREAATLMGLEDEYPLPAKYEDAFQLIGDGVATPAVRFLAGRLLEPLAKAVRASRALSETGGTEATTLLA